MAPRKATKTSKLKTSTKLKKAAVKRGPKSVARDDDHLHEDNGICACDLVFSAKEATADADLPIARGGIVGEKYRMRA